MGGAFVEDVLDGFEAFAALGGEAEVGVEVGHAGALAAEVADFVVGHLAADAYIHIRAL